MEVYNGTRVVMHVLRVRGDWINQLKEQQTCNAERRYYSHLYMMQNP